MYFSLYLIKGFLMRLPIGIPMALINAHLFMVSALREDKSASLWWEKEVASIGVYWVVTPKTIIKRIFLYFNKYVKFKEVDGKLTEFSVCKDDVL